MTDHETERLRDTIREVARAGGEPVPWHGVTQRATSPRPRATRSYRPLAATAAALAVVAAIVAVVAITTRPAEEAPADVTAQRVAVPHQVLEDVPRGLPLSVDIAARPSTLQSMLDELGIVRSDLDTVDLADEVVLRFTVGEPPGCPRGEVVGLSFDPDIGVLAPDFATPQAEPDPPSGTVRACVDMIGQARTVLLAVRRSDLPPAPFTLWIDHAPSPGVADRVLRVGPDDLYPVPVAIDPAEERPLITLGSFPWAIPVINWPIDAHVIVLYADGRVIWLREPPDSTGEVWAEQGRLTLQQVEALAELAAEAGLDEPGVQPSEPLPESMVGAIMDGGYSMLTFRTASGVGVAAVDQPGSSDGAADATGRRLQLEELSSAVWRSVRPASVETEPLPLTRWAVQSAGPMRTLDAERWPWDDLDPGSLDWSFNEFGVRCAILDRDSWPYDVDERGDWDARVSGIYRRPLMPHEQGCDDVFAWREELGIAAGSAFPHPPDVLPR